MRVETGEEEFVEFLLQISNGLSLIRVQKIGALWSYQQA